ncbi:hypothetical protein Q8814_01165 [Rhodococcus sp. CC-R104]|uniref:Uncharacterized protein n=2 Tax=Rhodococcus chondri TaxID=3065941 RepID=A0ABU7JL46_9NOCA|nr:hypothetical protein [Rhodococcus sp. CC-R104]MEE2030737.1 hypothetical protein [Rhodococcus sp. CC-R104]
MPPSREEPRGLLDALLTHRHDTLAGAVAAVGPLLAAPIVAAAEVVGPPDRDLVIELDTSGDAPAAAGWRPCRYQLDCTAAELDDILAFTAPAPLVVYALVDDGALAETARALTAAGHIPGLPTGHAPDAVADFLAVLAHADTGYVARATTADDVIALLAATVAALAGFDIRGALAAPEIAHLRQLVPEAVAALREILLAVEVPDTDAVARDLADSGLITR